MCTRERRIGVSARKFFKFCVTTREKTAVSTWPKSTIDEPGHPDADRTSFRVLTLSEKVHTLKQGAGTDDGHMCATEVRKETPSTQQNYLTS